MDNNQEAYQLFINELQNMRSELHSQRQQFENQLNSHQEREQNLRTELDNILNRQQQKDNSNTPRIPTSPRMSNQRPRHPDPEPFSGEDTKDYLPFKMNLRTKFTIDANCYSTEDEKVYYAYSRLRGKASQRMLPWLTAKQELNTPVHWDDFVQAMDKAFNDPDRQRKALVRINTMKQGRRTLEDFLNEFDGELLNAGGIVWADMQKKALLDTAVNWQLLQGMVGIEQANSYEGYCDQLRRINHDLQRVDHLSRRGTRTNTPFPQQNPPSGNPNQMDWEPTTTQVAATGQRWSTPRTAGKSARWASDEVLQTRRNEGKCLRCGSKEHFVRNCQGQTMHQAPHIATVEHAEDKQEEGKE